MKDEFENLDMSGIEKLPKTIRRSGQTIEVKMYSKPSELFEKYGEKKAKKIIESLQNKMIGKSTDPKQLEKIKKIVDDYETSKGTDSKKV